MIKKLLSLIATISFCLLAFSQTISFETSEGYTLGDINNQQGWNYLGNLAPNTGMVSNTAATTGSNALQVSGNNTTDDGSIRKTITGFNMTEYSFDYKIEGIDGSDYFMAVRDNSNSIIGAFVIDFEEGNLAVYNGITEDTDETAINISPDTWYNFKMVINKTTNTVQYFVNNTLLGSKSISSTATNVSIIDFGYADFGTGFTVDNIKIADSNLLATSDTQYDADIYIYPNPASDYINIKTQDKIGPVEIYDVSGKLVLKDLSGKNQVAVTSLQTGTYFLTVKIKDRLINKKFIKR
ncbi:T9SS type A sorting domain-containing protein [Chryseobacterium sp. SSA4.19]|uniref:T9SS type A sorting domain-containing protein n=1 Tax=Chryseobacterium sp. SSA4.19 TaxID=2919915 RepID=UPI001F4DEAF7|nr:T9SS type A sorting domain-containing protein [Chryseobacterium sp. SSA4.19]MCJ8154571.1 T9SS type A sorting domain-containing protein [Chryseobacterium sp. SSA4.19]